MGFRPSFYAENPKLSSLEILAWAVTRPCFTMGEARENFGRQLSGYNDPDHEISERLRKLRQSGMVLAATEGIIGAQEKNLQGDTKAISRLATIRRALERLNGQRRGPGRPPRLYFTTQAAALYVQRRADDLPKRGKGAR